MIFLILVLVGACQAAFDGNVQYTGHTNTSYEPIIDIEEIRYNQEVPQIVYEPKSRIEYEKVPKLTVETWNSIVEEEFPSVEYDFRTTDVPARLPRITYEYQEVNRTVRLPTICYKEINRIEYQAIPKIEYEETTQPRVIPVPIPTTELFEVKKSEIIPKLTHEWVAHKKTWPHPTIVLGDGEHIEEQVIVTGYESKYDECQGSNCPTPAPHPKSGGGSRGSGGSGNRRNSGVRSQPQRNNQNQLSGSGSQRNSFARQPQQQPQFLQPQQNQQNQQNQQFSKARPSPNFVVQQPQSNFRNAPSFAGNNKFNKYN